MDPSFRKNPYGFYSPFGFQRMPYMNRYKRFVHNDKHVKEIPKLENEIKSKENYEENSRYDDGFKEPVFELFGIKLFFDDILLISLIFFLYNEGVHDQYLFIALILLLLS